MYIGRSPHAYIEYANDYDLDRWINRKLMEWAERGRTHWQDASPFKTLASEPRYDVQDLARFGHRFIEVCNLTLDSLPLLDFRGRPGPVTQG